MLDPELGEPVKNPKTAASSILVVVSSHAYMSYWIKAYVFLLFIDALSHTHRITTIHPSLSDLSLS